MKQGDTQRQKISKEIRRWDREQEPQEEFQVRFMLSLCCWGTGKSAWNTALPSP